MKTYIHYLQSLLFAFLSIIVFSTNSQALTGTITGVVRDCSTGNPVVGAFINWGTYTTYSTTGGNYTLITNLAGTNTLMASKIGYNTLPIPGVTVTIPGTTTLNIQLNPGLLSPSNVNAVLNMTQTSTNISWNNADNIVELMYDNMIDSECQLYQDSLSFSAVKFTPCGYPAVLNSCKLDLCGTLSNFVPFKLYVYKDDGSGGMPGTILAGPFTVSPYALGWMNFTFPAPVNITAGNFYLAMEQISVFPNCAGLSVDTTNIQMRSFQKIGAAPWVPGGGNYLIHAILNEPCGLVLPGSITYTVSRLKQGQENSPALWTLVGSVTGGNSMVDGSWSGLPCNAYRWAVNPSYPCSGPIPAGFSNAIGKCWTANVTIHGIKCCAALPKAGMAITITNLDVPDTIYNVVTDTSGTVVISHMEKGNYLFNGNTATCIPVSLNATIDGDTTINIIMNTGVLPPPTDLLIGDTSLLVTWVAPVYYSNNLIDEKWTSGSFITNGWITSGGTNWQIDAGLGNPAPAARFNYLPQVIGYDQYLISKTITGISSPILQLKYDIQLDNYGTTTINTMSTEIWDGASWHVLKSYDNSSGNINWTTETIDISTYTSQSFKIRFHAHGGDSNDINYWAIDNISIKPKYDLPCLVGYEFSLNQTLGTFVGDTFYHIPPDQVHYGVAYVVCVNAVYNYLTGGNSSLECAPFRDGYLYPPPDFNADSIECSAFLTWQKPHYQNGIIPPGLVGYNIYRNQILVHYCPSPDTVNYYDLNLNPGKYKYSCTAKYDLSAYGLIGYNYSSPSFAWDSVTIICGHDLPFSEGWTENNFSYNGWTFDPSQGNWNVTSMTGNPAPSADFSWSGKEEKKIANYDFSMVSQFINASDWNCSHLYLDFDIKLVDRFSTSTEKMTIEAFYDQTWHPLGEYVNNGSFGWTTETFNIDSVRGKVMKIRFRAHGQNTNNILHWYIDNISIHGTCLPPAGLQWTSNSHQVNLQWSSPCTSVIGFNVFRSDSVGNPPFTKINPALVTATSYSDTPTGWSLGDTYRYYVTAVLWNHVTDSILCESASDTIIAAYPTGIPEQQDGKITIFPNPAENYLIIRSELPLIKLEVLSDLGRIIFSSSENNVKYLKLNTSEYSQGIYFIRLSTSSGTLYRKVVICR